MNWGSDSVGSQVDEVESSAPFIRYNVKVSEELKRSGRRGCYLM